MADEISGQVEAEQPIEQAMLAFVEKAEEPKKEPAQAETQAEETKTEPAKPETEPEKEVEKIEIRRHKLTVKTDEGKDEEVEVDEDELKRGYMKDRDYRAKTAIVAREREAIQEKIKEQLNPALSHYQQNLQFFEKALWKTLAPEMESVDWNALAKDNPAEWAAKMQAVNNVNGLLQAVKQEQEKLGKQQQEEQAKVLQKQAAESLDVLRRDIPGWNNETYNSTLEAGLKYGFTREELNAVIDHRAIKILRDASEYRKLQENKPAMEKKVVDVPKVLKPGTATKPDQTREELSKRMDQLRKTGSMDDARRAAMLLIK